MRWGVDGALTLALAFVALWFLGEWALKALVMVAAAVAVWAA